MKKYLLIVLLSIIAQSDNINPKFPPLFGEVINIINNDSLNVRVSPNWHSKKIGALPKGGVIGLDRCKKIGDSIWCKVFHLTQRDYEEYGSESKSGWVNAKFLRANNIGYVIINSRANCDYAIKCIDNKCEVVVDYKQDKNGNITFLKTQWVNREKLRGSTNFGAMAEDGEGYCVIGNKIKEYLGANL